MFHLQVAYPWFRNWHFVHLWSFPFASVTHTLKKKKKKNRSFSLSLTRSPHPHHLLYSLSPLQNWTPKTYRKIKENLSEKWLKKKKKNRIFFLIAELLYFSSFFFSKHKLTRQNGWVFFPTNNNETEMKC